MYIDELYLDGLSKILRKKIHKNTHLIRYNFHFLNIKMNKDIIHPPNEELKLFTISLTFTVLWDTVTGKDFMDTLYNPSVHFSIINKLPRLTMMDADNEGKETELKTEINRVGEGMLRKVREGKQDTEKQ